ncbi:hypothetical protein M5K25_018965 [Dendrobium thyrsiflorum]|uniref:Uncharacterized protein n=1 Tax=Dendrobium thyrsiflorum TaxID=117978 RepID=A0ABD0UDX5_DENTH
MASTGSPTRAQRIFSLPSPASTPQTVPEDWITAMVAAEPSPSAETTIKARKTAAAAAGGIVISSWESNERGKRGRRWILLRGE